LAAGLTQEALARRVGVEPNTIARYERGELAISVMAERAIRTATEAHAAGARRPGARRPRRRRSPMRTTEFVSVTVAESELTPRAREFLSTLRRQSSHYTAILTPKDGMISLDLWDNDGLGSDDTIRIRVRDRLGYAARARRFGIEGLPRCNSTGECGPQGDPIPTEDYLRDVIAGYGDDIGAVRFWDVPLGIIRAVRKGDIEGAEALDRCAAALARYCEDGEFEVG